MTFNPCNILSPLNKLCIPSPVPVSFGNSLTGFLRIAPVSVHHTVASDHQLSSGTQRHNFPSISVHHFSLQLRLTGISHMQCGDIQIQFWIKYKMYLSVIQDTSSSVQLQFLSVLWETHKCTWAILSRSIKNLLKHNAHMFFYAGEAVLCSIIL